MNPIKDAIALAGSITELAHSLGVTPQAVCFWRDGKRKIPAEKCPLIERVTRGAVSCEVLRPDVDWSYIRGTPQVQVGVVQPAIEQRQADEPWDGKTERHKLDAPIDCRVSPESVARAKFLRSQSAAKQEGI